ncbi:NtaA/DmoA family FMN-dependent monooxygenase [Streptomyces bobili]|uniref:NtaA/DmoA family FMN-dependent monooxygenase n=1 Tax=Streptomyces bobili TaxID=67280 RepID=UPI003658E7B1
MPRTATVPLAFNPVPRVADPDRRRTSASVILRSVLEHGPVARSTIARLTGLSPASVTDHCARLAGLGLVREAELPRRSNGVGRPHVPVDLDGTRFVVGGVHVAVPYTTVALLDLRGRMVARRELKHRGTEPAGVLARAAEGLAGLCAKASGRRPVATASTSYNSPYNLARRFASLDIVSGGRAGWNIVTTAGAEAARNFGPDAEPAHAERYARAAEFLDVALKLWDSWEDDAIVAAKAAGVWGDDAKIHPPRHRGTHFSVEGALNVPRSPQGYPLLVQAGSSEDGKAFAARYAEAVFTAQQTLADAQAFYTDLKARTVRAGRDPEHLKVLPGIVAVIGSTEAEARAHERELEEHIVPAHGVRRLEQLLRLEPGTLALDAELPADLPPEDAIEAAHRVRPPPAPAREVRPPAPRQPVHQARLLCSRPRLKGRPVMTPDLRKVTAHIGAHVFGVDISTSVAA